MKIETYHSPEEKARWKLVRTDNYADVQGEIQMADEDSGECSVTVQGETKVIHLGPGGLKIVARGR